MNIKFGMDNYYVRYLKRFLNKELGISNRVLGDFDKSDQQALISYLNLPNVKNMFDVQKELLQQNPLLSTYFNSMLKDNLITFTAKSLSLEISNWLTHNVNNIDNYCKSCGWKLITVNEWLNTTMDINGDGVVDEKDSLIVYNIIHNLEEYDPEIVERADLNLDGQVTQDDLDIIIDYLNTTKINFTIQQEDRKNYFPNEDMKIFINQFDGSFMYNYAIRDNGYGTDDLPHENNTGKFKIALYKCTPGQKITIAHNSGNTEHMVIGCSNAILKDSIPSTILQHVVEIDLKPGQGYQYTTSKYEDGTGYDAQWLCVQCPSSYNKLQGGSSKTLILEIGDINFDGKIDMSDYEILAQYTATGPGSEDLPYNKVNWTPTKKQLKVMDIPIWDENSNDNQFGEAGQDGEITRTDAVYLYKFITNDPSAPPSLGITTYTYTDNSDEQVEEDNIEDLLIIDGHFYNYNRQTQTYAEGFCVSSDIVIPFEEFTQDSWIIHHKFFNYLLNMAVQPYTNSENITYMQKLLKAYYPEHQYQRNYLYPGSYSTKMKDLVKQYQLSHTNYTYGDLNVDGKIDNNDLILERFIIETLNADIDGDNKITQEDFNLLRDYLAGTGTLTPEQLLKADVNFDGVIDNQDLAIIQEYLDGVRKDTVHQSDGSIGVQQSRADVNQDGKWDAQDYNILQQQVNGETSILTNYSLSFMLGYIDVDTETLLEQECNLDENISEVSK